MNTTDTTIEELDEDQGVLSNQVTVPFFRLFEPIPYRFLVLNTLL
jgi:hypothetical protein